MKKYARHFLLEDSRQLEGIKQQLAGLMSLKENPQQTQQCVYYDSFDWRLYKKQKLLVAEPNDSGAVLYTENLLSGKRSKPLQVSEMPRFAWDLPDSAWRDNLDAWLEMRTLLPQLEARIQQRSWTLLEAGQKRLFVHLSLPQLAGSEKKLPIFISLQPLKGENKAARQVSEFLQQTLGLPSEETPLAVHLLKHSEKQPGCYSSKLNLSLQPDMPANQAAKAIFKTLLAILRDNEAGIKDDLDSEFLHDYRVAVRRTRTALTQLPDVLPKGIIERMRKRFAQLGQITTPTRDLDVYLLKFADYRALLPAHTQADLAPLYAYLQQQRTVQLGRLQQYLKTATHKKFIHDWQTFLNAPTRPHHLLVNSARPIKDLANERICKAYRKILQQGMSIKPSSPATALHELRKQGKKLRYLLEFFQNLYAPKEINKLLKILKNLQENLGDIQDYEVQAVYLRQIATELDNQQTSTATLLAMGMLVGQLEQLQQQARDEFAQRFADFARKPHQQLFADLCKCA